MSRLKGALLCTAAAALISMPAAAQITGHPVEISAGAGIFKYDVRSYTKPGPAIGGALGWRLAPWLTLEGTGVYSASEADTFSALYAGEPKRTFLYAGADLRWNLRPADGRVLPYLLSGAGYAKSHWEGDPQEDLARGSASVGLGVLVNMLNQRTYLRLQARDIMFQERYQSQFLNHFAVTAGIHYALGGKVRDVDHDRVRDWLDTCPETPIGAVVDAKGCPIDSDHDGVFDGLDKCPGTPPGCTVDATGCPVDTDGDGVCDGVDQCPGTPRGALVDAKGCPIDSDGDGVFDGLDKCPNTMKGCAIDSTGCPTDADGDGVCDGVDQCLNTPAGIKVTETGCPIEITWREKQILDTGLLRQSSSFFAVGKAELGPEAPAVLDSLALVLQQYPALKLEISGHTDNTGSVKKNQTLSEARAKGVFDYLTGKNPGLAGNLTWKGYGLNQPVAPNTTAKGKAMNRRVELRVLNPEALQIEREKRRYLLKDEALPPVQAPAPADTTRH